MSDDDETRVPTVRPPPGDEDIYSAETRVGAMSPEVAAILEQARAADDQHTNAADSSSHTSKVPTAPEPKAAVPTKATATGGISPVLSIGFVFVITAVVLAALTR
jgi:hypothetical protein